MGSEDEWASLDEFKVKVMAIYKAIGSKAGKRFEALRAGGFDVIEPMQ